MGMLRIMSRQGDTQVRWDTAAVAAADPEALAAIREAEHVFAAERARGATAFSVRPGGTPIRVDYLDPSAEQIVLVPRVVGG
jgi:uncharacterized protein YjiK